MNSLDTVWNLSAINWIAIYMSPGAIYICYNLISLYRNKQSRFVAEVLRTINRKSALRQALENSLVYSVAGVCVLVAWPAFLIWRIFHPTKKESHGMEEAPSTTDLICKSEYLVSEISPIEAEVFNQVYDPLGNVPNLPFGHLNDAWGGFLSQMLNEKDAMWSFFIPRGSEVSEYQTTTSEIRGYAHLRDGKILGEFITESD